VICSGEESTYLDCRWVEVASCQRIVVVVIDHQPPRISLEVEPSLDCRDHLIEVSIQIHAGKRTCRGSSNFAESCLPWDKRLLRVPLAIMCGDICEIDIIPSGLLVPMEDGIDRFRELGVLFFLSMQQVSIQKYRRPSAAALSAQNCIFLHPASLLPGPASTSWKLTSSSLFTSHVWQRIA